MATGEDWPYCLNLVPQYQYDESFLQYLNSLVGRGLGGFLSSLAAHYFGLMKVFVGAALISLFVAAAWFLWIHLIANSLRIQQKKSCCSCQSFCRRKNRATLDPTAVDDVDDFDSPTQFPKGIEMLFSPSLFLSRRHYILLFF